ncbi:unnamed protein product [Penicillium nalgiovense]|nr:unnamed protein product [Penicillium nalgiovense]
MTTAPPVHHSGPDSGIPGHLVNHLPRYHPIAMNPNPPPHQMPPPEQMVQSHHFRHFAPPMHEHHPREYHQYAVQLLWNILKLDSGI